MSTIILVVSDYLRYVQSTRKHGDNHTGEVPAEESLTMSLMTQKIAKGTRLIARYKTTVTALTRKLI